MCSNKCSVDYVVVKINGVDINQMPKCEAVQTFLQTKGPIVVELCRRTSSDCDVGRGSVDVEKLRISTDDSKLNKNKSASASPNLKKTTYEIRTLKNSQSHAAYDNELVLTLQTNSISSMGMEKASNEDAAQQTKPSDLVFLTRETQTDDQSCVVGHNAQHEMARKLADRLIEQEHHLFEQCLEPEIDIEEVTLTKNVGSKEHLGLTICYSSIGSNSGSSVAVGSTAGNNINNNNGGACGLNSADDSEPCTEVFISDIQPNSVAERDGRLRRGDQILQINGHDIKSREDTDILMSENSNSLTLLVSRYLYAEDEASEDDDDDDDEEYYVDNNLAYANGFIVNDYTNVVDKLDRALTLDTQAKKGITAFVPTVEQVDCLITPDTNATSNAKDAVDIVLDIKSTSAQSIKKAHNLKSTASAKTVETKSNFQDVNIGASENERLLALLPTNSQSDIRHSDVNNTQANLSNSARKYEYDETEHIYETIPEDSESEPFYCSPYQSSTYMTAVGSCSSATVNDALELQQQKQRVAQWLGIKSNAVSMHTIATTPAVRLSLYGGNRTATTMSQRTANKICTMRSAITNTTSGSSSSGAGCSGPQANVDTINPIDELENSSSAYNTGGSNNSASPLALALSKTHQQTTVGQDMETGTLNTAKNRCGNQTMLNKSQRLQSPKEQTITSPKNIIAPFGKSVVIDNSARNKISVDDQQTFSKTLFRNESNSYQAALVQQQQQQYYRNTGHQQQRQLEQPMTSSQFNAPNLSQYHFVSSQEVASSSMNVITASPKITLPAAEVTKIVDEDATPMVWKVKRRPDGTRYIVRRPARNRLPCVRRTIRNNDITTTEDDTISEVKIGRYWTKEERKRHIERARERRQQQQQQQLQ